MLFYPSKIIPNVSYLKVVQGNPTEDNAGTGSQPQEGVEDVSVSDGA